MRLAALPRRPMPTRSVRSHHHAHQPDHTVRQLDSSHRRPHPQPDPPPRHGRLSCGHPRVAVNRPQADLPQPPTQHLTSTTTPSRYPMSLLYVRSGLEGESTVRSTGGGGSPRWSQNWQPSGPVLVAIRLLQGGPIKLADDNQSHFLTARDRETWRRPPAQSYMSVRRPIPIRGLDGTLPRMLRPERQDPRSPVTNQV
jgi:hypothetical protein